MDINQYNSSATMYLRGVALYAIHAVTLTTFEVYQIQHAVSKWRQGVRRKGIVSVGTNSWPYYLNTIANSQVFALITIAFQYWMALDYFNSI